jgi:cytochrome c-type biogenesis protein
MLEKILHYIQNFEAFLNAETLSLVLLPAAFLGGVLASLSPCTLGLLPIITGYVIGYGEGGKKGHAKTFVQMFAFVLGLSSVLTVVGMLCALGGKVFSAFGGDYFALVLASVVFVFGLSLAGILELNLPPIVKRMPKMGSHGHFVYPFIVGAVFALAATPCSTPILAGIMSFAALSTNILYAAALLLLFALGQGSIIILVGISASFLKNLKAFAQISEILMKLSGYLLILGALIIYFKVFAHFVI